MPPANLVLKRAFQEDAIFQTLPEYIDFLKLLRAKEEQKDLSFSDFKQWIQQPLFPIDLGKVHSAMLNVDGYNDVKHWKQVLLSVSTK